MSNTPRFDALLHELLQLDEEDRQLPLPVLLNLHRTQLRAPLRGLGVYARDLRVQTRDGVVELKARLHKAYGLDGNLLETQEILDLYERVDDEAAWALAETGSDLTRRERYLIAAADMSWLSFDPLVWLCFLAHRELPPAGVPELLEAELKEQPATHRLVLDMAALAPKRRRKVKQQASAGTP